MKVMRSCGTVAVVKWMDCRTKVQIGALGFKIDPKLLDTSMSRMESQWVLGGTSDLSESVDLTVHL